MLFFLLHLDWFGFINNQKFMYFIYLAFGVMILHCKLGYPLRLHRLRIGFWIFFCKLFNII